MQQYIHRKWFVSISTFFLVFVVLNYIIWKGFTEDILSSRKYHNADLARIGYIPNSKHYRTGESTLPRKHLESPEYNGQPIDMLTIGDSFSNMTDNGKDPLYQDWMASLHGLSIMNMKRLKGMDPLSTAIILLNSGYLDEIKPKVLLVESLESVCIDLFGKPVDFALTRDLGKIKNYYRTYRPDNRPPELGFINSSNFKFLLNSILYRYSNNAFFSKVYMMDLNRPFFTVKNRRKLLFYFKDIDEISTVSPASFQQLNDNFNELANRLNKKGIVLYFMPAADKYDMYRDYIVNNPYPKNAFFEIMRALPKNYYFLDTGALLSEEIAKGEQDIYYADDTHWSWKASKKIAESLQFVPALSR